MGRKEEFRTARLKKEIIPKLIADGKLGNANPESKLEDVVILNNEAGTDHWASASFFADVHLKNKGQKFTEKIMVKYPPLSEYLRRRIRSHKQYENECVTYKTIIPEYKNFLKEQSEKLNNSEISTLLDGMFPTCYYAEYDPIEPENSVVILNDLRELGYKVASHRNSLDINHAKLAFKLIAKYHGVGYAYKLAKRKEFEELMSKIEATRYCEEARYPNQVGFNVPALRPIRRLLKDGSDEIKKDDLEKLKTLFSDTFSVMMYLTRKTDMSVLCHGDFCANNILFRYDGSGRPEASALIDFQVPYYGSPNLDLSFFLYVGTDQDFRIQYFNELMHFYHSTVTETMSKILGRPITEPGFRYDDFKKDFANHAVYGYSIATFFLPVMMEIDKEPFDLETNLKKDDTMDYEERRKDIESKGGEAATVALVKLFLELYEKGYFEDLLKNFSVDTHL